MTRDFVFGYGSLAAELPFVPGREPCDAGFVADLPGFARGWGVAMDNRRDLPGYKYYMATDGTRPAVFVSFLDIAPAAGDAAVNGLCLPVDPAAWNGWTSGSATTHRVDVSDRIHGRRGARLDLRRHAGRPRAAAGARRTGSAVIAAAYLAAVERRRSPRWAPTSSRAAAPSLAPGDRPGAVRSRPSS